MRLKAKRLGVLGFLSSALLNNWNNDLLRSCKIRLHCPVTGQEVGDEELCPPWQPPQQHKSSEDVLGVLDGCFQPLFISAV